MSPQDVARTVRTNKDHVVIDVEETPTDKSSTSMEVNAFDDDLLHRAVQDAGRWAFGTVVVEIWVLNDEKTELFRPQGGWWVDPAWHCCPKETASNCMLCRLTDPGVVGYKPPPPVAPGVGLAGVLWSEARRFEAPRRPIVWRDLKALQQDPDQPSNSRLKMVGEVGLGYAGAVPFHLNGQSGIVIFVARTGVDLNKLRSQTNETYMRSASDLIAAAWALRGPRRAVEQERKQELDASLRRARIKLLAMVRLGIPLDGLVGRPPEPLKHQQESFEHKVVRYGTSVPKALWKRLVVVAKKCRGAGVDPSPSFPIGEACWTFVGVFCTLLVLTGLNTGLGNRLGDDWTMELGPFGALMTLQYGLTAAPASQPTNAILGQAVALSIAIGIASVPGLDLWLRQTIATSLAITTMVKCGIIHPPAGAAALIFAAGNNSWSNMAMMLVGNAIAVIMATLINNVDLKRQYPMSWGVGFAIKRVRSIVKSAAKSE